MSSIKALEQGVKPKCSHIRDQEDWLISPRLVFSKDQDLLGSYSILSLPVVLPSINCCPASYRNYVNIFDSADLCNKEQSTAIISTTKYLCNMLNCHKKTNVFAAWIVTEFDLSGSASETEFTSILLIENHSIV